MTVSVYQPQIRVTLHKLIGRRAGLSERFTEAKRRIDLTPFLGEGASVVTTKGIRDPAGGFVVTLVDRMDARRAEGLASLDTLYGFIEPMDLVEIRMARNPDEYDGQRPPVVMRGFVTAVNRREAMGNDGKPTRRVIVSGQDYGKISQMVQIFYRTRYTIGEDLLAAYKLSVAFGFVFAWLPANRFIGEAVDKLLNRYLRGMQTIGDLPEIGQFRTDLSVPAGRVAPYGIQNFEGTIASFMSTWADLPWNELFVEDRDPALDGAGNDGVYYVYRPIPWKDVDGITYILPGAKDPGRTRVSERDIGELALTHADTNVANWFWVEAPTSTLADTHSLNIQSLSNGEGIVADNPNADANLYGLRKMAVRSNQGSDGMRGSPNNLGPTEKAAYVGKRRDWLTVRREQLRALHQDNVVFERGSIKLKGSEKLRAGRYLEVERGGLLAEYYVTQVQHTFEPYNAFRSEVTVERGTGFIKRTSLPQSPYLLEGARGPYRQ